jgi:hypothetical protein
MANAFMSVLTFVSVIALPTDTSTKGNAPLIRGPVHEDVIRLQEAGYGHTNGDGRFWADIHAALASAAARQQAFSGYGSVNFGPPVFGAATAARLASYRSVPIET